MAGVGDSLTQYGDHLVVLDHLEATRHDEAQRVDGLARVVQQVAGRRVRHVEVHGQRAQASVGRQPERRVLVEHLAVEVHADVRLHVLRAVIQHLRPTRSVREGSIRGEGTERRVAVRANLIRVQAFGHRPRGDDVVHDALAERLGYLVQLHELAYVVQHIVVLGRRRRHLLDDGRHVSEYCGVQ